MTTILRDEFHQGGRLCFELDVEQNARVQTDPDVVTTIMRHLVSNALKFSAANRPVHVTFALHSRRLTATIADTSIGIPAAEQERVFELFYHAGNIGTQHGLGMGLHIARKMTDRIDADLRLTSLVDEGTTAVLSLPLIVES